MKTDTLLELDLQLTNKTLTVYFESVNEKVEKSDFILCVCNIFKDKFKNTSMILFNASTEIMK